MKGGRITALLLAAAMLGGCTVAATETEKQAAVRMAVISADEEFLELLEARAGNNIQLSEETDEADINLLYMPEQDKLTGATTSDVVLTDDINMLPEDVAAVIIDERAAVEAAWEALYTYPAHSTPIRLLMLTESGASLSREIFDSMVSQGKLQDKGSYIGSQTEQNPEEWVSERLQDIPVGLLDTIYAETEELAVAAYNALRNAERNDSVEVICPVMSEKLIALMVEDHWSMGVCVDVSMKEGADAMLELAEELASTGKHGTISLEPRVIYSDEVKALVDSGVTDVTEIIDTLVN